MKRLALALLAMMIGRAQAAPLAPVTDGQLNGVPLAEALINLNILGQWQLPQGGWVRLMTAETPKTITCESADADSSACNLRTLFIGLYEAPTIPMDFTLFRGPDKVVWVVAKGQRPRGATLAKDAQGNSSLRLLACEVVANKTAQGTDYRWMADTYVLSLNEHSGAAGHVFAFDAALERAAGRQVECPANH